MAMFSQRFLSSRSWLLLLFWICFNYQCDLIANAEDGVTLIFFLQNTMAAMSHDDPSLPFDFKFPFQNKSILIKSNLINKTRQQMKNNIQVKV